MAAAAPSAVANERGALPPTTRPAAPLARLRTTRAPSRAPSRARAEPAAPIRGAPLPATTMSLLDRVLHKHKARSSAELVSRAASVLDALDVWHGPSPDKQLDEAGRLLGAIKV